MMSDTEEAPLIIEKSPSRFRCPSVTCRGQFRDVIAAGIACLSAVSMGFVLGYSAPALLDNDLLIVLDDDDDKKAWFSSLVTLGAIAGGPLAAIFVEHIGRKATLLVCSLPLAAGWFMILVPEGLTLLYCGRFITGIAIGMISVASPLYIAEVSTKQHRGMLGSGFQLFATVGIMLVYALGLGLNWNWLATVGIVLAGIGALIVLPIPETPRWLMSRNNRDDARSALKWLTSAPESDIEHELAEMEENIAGSQGQRVGLREFLLPGIYKPLLISLGLMLFQQFSGINTVIFYSSRILQSAGFSHNPLVPSIAVAGILVLFNAISCVLMDRAGRRILLLISGFFLTISCFGLGTYYYIQGHDKGEGYSWLSLGSLCLFVAAFSIGWGPIPWLVMSELFPIRSRGVASGIATFFNWLFAFIVTKEFLPVAAAITYYGTYFAFAVINFLGMLFVFFLLPETKQRSLEEIERLFVS